MDDGLFQLLFFGVLILASIFDAATRGRRRRRRMEEMEREEQAEEAEERVETTMTRRRPEALPRPGPESAGGQPSGQRETADSMVPDDLWAVLTGQKPTAEGPPIEAESEETRRPEPVLEPEVVRGPPPPEVETIPEAQPVPAPWTPTPAPLPSTSPRVRIPAGAPVARVTPILREGTGKPLRGAGPKGSAAGYAASLRAGGADSLRQAIVLTEVLGVPAALRPHGRGWEDR